MPIANEHRLILTVSDTLDRDHDDIADVRPQVSIQRRYEASARSSACAEMSSRLRAQIHQLWSG